MSILSILNVNKGVAQSQNSDKTSVSGLKSDKLSNDFSASMVQHKKIEQGNLQEIYKLHTFPYSMALWWHRGRPLHNCELANMIHCMTTLPEILQSS